MSLRDAIAALPDEAMVPVGWIREQLGAGSDDRLVDLNIEEVAQRLNRAPSTIRSWLIAGELRGYKVHNREWRVSPAAISEFFEAQRNGSGRRAVRRSGKTADLAAWKNVKT